MHWLALLGLVAAVVGLVALTRSAPEGGRPAGRTRLMSAARVVLALLGVAALAWLLLGIS